MADEVAKANREGQNRTLREFIGFLKAFGKRKYPLRKRGKRKRQPSSFAIRG